MYTPADRIAVVAGGGVGWRAVIRTSDGNEAITGG
jgi:hypothetical protein